MPNAFRSWLLQDKARGCQHILDCLRGPGGELAWELMAVFNGPDWRCPPGELPALIEETWEKLKANPDQEAEEEEE